jgi:hypothetical protein
MEKIFGLFFGVVDWIGLVSGFLYGAISLVQRVEAILSL